MGLNRQLANLPDAITTDTSNNVGIGGSPSGTYKFEVTGYGRFNNASGMALQANGGTFTQATASSYSLGIGNTGGSDLTLGTSTTAGVIQTWSSKPLVLNPQGNSVGIGTSTPSYLFDITKESDSNTSLAYIKNTAAGRPAYLSFKSPAFNFVTGIKNDVGYVIANNDGTISSDTQIKFCINSSGNVGIGTASPTYALQVNGNDRPIVMQAATVNKGIVIAYNNSVGTLRAYVGFGGDSSSTFEVSNNENGPVDIRTNALFTARFTSGGNLLIGTTTDSGYKLAVNSGHQYLGTGFQITGTFGQVDRQCATAFADFSGPTVTFDLASIFPRTTFLNRGLSVTMQLVALPTYTIVNSAFVVLARTGNSNAWSSAILANININGASISSISATGTTITIVYNTHIFGTAYINLATIG